MISIKEKFTEIAKKYHLHHYGDLEPAIEEMIIYVNKTINNMKTLVEIDVNKELPMELQTVTTDKGECYYSHVHLQWFHAENNKPFDADEIKPHTWQKLVNATK
jgi:hypothetical protein